MNFLSTQYSRKCNLPGKIELKISFSSYHFSCVRETILLQRHRLMRFFLWGWVEALAGALIPLGDAPSGAALLGNSAVPGSCLLGWRALWWGRGRGGGGECFTAPLAELEHKAGLSQALFNDTSMVGKWRFLEEVNHKLFLFHCPPKYMRSWTERQRK